MLRTSSNTAQAGPRRPAAASGSSTSQHSPYVGPWINSAYTQDHALSAWPSGPCRGRHGSRRVQVGTTALRFAALRGADETVSMALILVVEDEAAVAEVIAETLIQRGHETRVAVSAAHAALIVKSERSDLMLLDINLPDSAARCCSAVCGSYGPTFRSSGSRRIPTTNSHAPH